LPRCGGHGTDQERDHADDAPPERVLLDFAEPKNQERPHRQDHEHDKPDQEISAPRMAVFDGKVCRDRPRANALNRRDTMWLEVFTRPTDATAEVSWRGSA
jgi:hypothetical protein